MMRMSIAVLSAVALAPHALALQQRANASVPFAYVWHKLSPDANTMMKQKSVKTHDGPRDLVLMHVPYNFGHTIEKVALLPESEDVLSTGMYLSTLGLTGGRKATWGEIGLLAREEGEAWGHFNPDLQEYSNVSGCQLYYTPQKYWPEHVLKKYFGNKKIFGMLRDPYERLVAFFRGNVKGYGGEYPEFYKTCDVNGAVKMMMKRHIASGNKFEQGCTFLPQAEFFEGPYGIQIPVDNRKFPASMNALFQQHGYEERLVKAKDILHVSGCSEVWAGDLDAETRSLVQQVYKQDFELLCRYFGYCDPNENTCISQVPEMCPKRVLPMIQLKNGPVLEDTLAMHAMNVMREKVPKLKKQYR